MSDDIRERLAYVAIQAVPHAHLCRDARREIDRLRSRNEQLEAALQKIMDATPAHQHQQWPHHHWYLATAREALSDEPEQGGPSGAHVSFADTASGFPEPAPTPDGGEGALEALDWPVDRCQHLHWEEMMQRAEKIERALREPRVPEIVWSKLRKIEQDAPRPFSECACTIRYELDRAIAQSEQGDA